MEESIHSDIKNITRETIPKIGTILALDWGKSRIGLAISDGLQISANPLQAIISKNRNRKEIIAEIQLIIGQREAKGVVIGLPISLNETLGGSAKEVILFARKLKEQIKIPISFQDESFSTSEALNILSERSIPIKKRKELKDSMSAVVILESFISKRY